MSKWIIAPIFCNTRGENKKEGFGIKTEMYVLNLDFANEEGFNAEK